MTKLLKLLNEVRKDEQGATMVEYAIMVGLIAVVSIGTVTVLGKTINTLFSNINGQLP